MPAPVPAATPHAPTGLRIENGHPTIITLSAKPNLALWETSVKPPGVDGGEANDLTNMHNTDWRTFAPRTLKTLTPVTFTAQYDAAAYSDLVTNTNVHDTVTIHFPSGDTIAFFGYLRMFDPADATEGTPPTATVTIQPTNRDPSDDSEQPPVITLSVGTAARLGLLKEMEARETRARIPRSRKAPSPQKKTQRGKSKKGEAVTAV